MLEAIIWNWIIDIKQKGDELFSVTQMWVWQVDLFEKLIKIVRKERDPFPAGYLEKTTFNNTYCTIVCTQL